jgi:predicted NodU family carbamoyl transferase
MLEDLEISVSILGLNAFHGDSSAALVRDGEPIAAAEEG